MKTITHIIFFIAFFLFIATSLSSKAYSEGDIVCSAGVTPSSVSPGSTETLRFSIVNQDTNVNLVWAKIERPSTKYTIESASVNTGSVTNDSTSITVTDLAVWEGSVVVTATVSVSSTESSAQSWKVRGSSEQDGSSSVLCSGYLDTSIRSDQSPEAPDISAITVSEISTSSAKIRWTTDEDATSVVEFGLSPSLGKSKSESKRVKSHSITLKDLKSNKVYYYKVKSADSDGNTAQTLTNTFVTSKEASSTVIVVPDVEVKEASPAVEYIYDRVPPKFLIKTDLSRTFLASPRVSGTVTDNTSVGKLSFSVDGGENWIPVPIKADQSQANFDIELPKLEDGDHILKFLAVDTSGNTSVSEGFRVVIDVLPPVSGTIVAHYGPLVLEPSDSGQIFIPSGEIGVAMSAVGGPSAVNITSALDLSKTKELSDLGYDTIKPTFFGSGSQTSPVYHSGLTKDVEVGIWRGVLNYDGAGVYDLSVLLEDSGQHKVEKRLAQAVVLPNGVVTHNRKVVTNAQVTVHTYDFSTKGFNIWDAEPYEQINPQKTDAYGEYRLVLPEGRYYLSVEKDGYAKVRTEIFSISKPTIINKRFVLESRGVSSILNLGGLFKWPKAEPISVTYPGISSGSISGSFRLPDFSTFSSGQGSFDPLSIRGKPSVITFMNTWAPFSGDQLQALALLSEKVNSVVILPLESQSSADLFKRKGDYGSLFFGDPKGAVFSSLGLTFSPTHLFLDRKGNVTSTKVGILNEKEIEDNLIIN